MLRSVVFFLAMCGASAMEAAPMNHDFASIDGGQLALSEWEGQPVMVVNTASQCAFTRQYKDLQALYDKYRDDGLVVVAVPSDDFRQELNSAEEVKEFCEINYGIDMPMADITHVRGANAHPFYQEVKAETGFVPAWNFNKVLIGRDGTVLKTWGSTSNPLSRSVTKAVEAALAE